MKASTALREEWNGLREAWTGLSQGWAGSREASTALREALAGLKKACRKWIKTSNESEEARRKASRASGIRRLRTTPTHTLCTPSKFKLMGRVRGAFMMDMALHFVCPYDMSKVPCGDRGNGYRLRKTRAWVKKISPALQV